MGIPVTSGLQLLLDASMITGLSDGASVTSWADQSGQGNNGSVPTGNTAPVYKTNIIGTHPVVRFGAATSDGMKTGFSSWTTSTGSTDIIAFANCVAGAGQNTKRYAATAASGDYDTFGNNAAMQISSSHDIVQFCEAMYLIPNNNTQVNYAAGAPQLAAVLGIGCSATNAVMYLNGLKAFASAGSYVMGAIGISSFGQNIEAGALRTDSCPHFDVAFRAIYSRLLSHGEFQSVQQWMMTRLELAAFAAPSIGVSSLLRRK